jgi:hypothetical protein
MTANALCGGCDNLQDYIDEAKDSLVEGQVMPVVDQFYKKDLEQVGAVIDPNATCDCFSRFDHVLRPSHDNVLPSRSVMQASQMAIGQLLNESPIEEKPPKWLLEMKFSGGKTLEVAENVNNLRVWGRNDVHGAQYFASCILPNVTAEEASKRLWKTTGVQHVYNTDDAPYAVLQNLSGDARIEYHHIPTAHMLSTISSYGFQYDSREAAVLVEKATFPLANKAVCHMVWMKSIRHPDLSGSEEVQPAASVMKSYSAGTKLANIEHVQPYVGKSTRALIRLRAMAFYQDPATQKTVCCCFGHEDPAGGFNALEKTKYYLSFGFTTGGVEEIVKFNLQRLSHILPSHRDASIKTVASSVAFTAPPPSR